MNHAIRIHEYGGPEKMVWEELPLPHPKPGEALVRHHAVGLNYIDVYFRTGLYKAPSLPATIGMEGAGVVEAVGEGVTRSPWATAWPMRPARSAPMPKAAP
jgi:NADPH2:quinone reductase